MSSITIGDLPRRVDAAQRVLRTLAVARTARCTVCRGRIAADEPSLRIRGLDVHQRCAGAQPR